MCKLKASSDLVFTANVLDTIPAPLLDRMEVLEVSGYVSEEKACIAQTYLGPQAKEASGLNNADVQLDPAAVDVLIKYYCRESGVRNLKKHIDKVCARPITLAQRTHALSMARSTVKQRSSWSKTLAKRSSRSQQLWPLASKTILMSRRP